MRKFIHKIVSLFSDTTSATCSVHFSPTGGCTSEIVKQINNAKSYVYVLSYDFTSAPIEDALISAFNRGIDVKFIMDHRASEEKSSLLSIVATAKIPCWTDAKHNIMHNKVMIIDDLTVLTGSFNFTSNAEFNNAENLLTIIDADLAKEYKDNWDHHLSHSVKV